MDKWERSVGARLHWDTEEEKGPMPTAVKGTIDTNHFLPSLDEAINAVMLGKDFWLGSTAIRSWAIIECEKNGFSICALLTCSPAANRDMMFWRRRGCLGYGRHKL